MDKALLDPTLLMRNTDAQVVGVIRGASRGRNRPRATSPAYAEGTGHDEPLGLRQTRRRAEAMHESSAGRKSATSPRDPESPEKLRASEEQRFG